MVPVDPGASFRERYDHLVDELAAVIEEIPELEVEPQGTDGLRVRFPPTDREVRITPLEEQSFVHFVFGHATVGTLHRAEHHASRPFADAPPDVPRLARQLLDFLIEGTEPRWLSQRPEPTEERERPRPRSEEEPDGTLELPLE